MINPNAFNIQTFGINTIKSIDGIRAYTSSGSVSSTESRINALYRAIGLPSILNGNISTTGIAIDPVNTANTFDIKELNDFDTANITQILANRETSCYISATNQEQQLFLDNNTLQLSCGIPIFSNGNIIPNIAQTKQLRQRGILFPMVVNGSLSVLPTNNRLAGAFLSDNDIVINNIQYNRPFIETIISISLRGTGIAATQAIKAIQDNLNLPTSVVNNTSQNIVSNQIIQSIINIINNF